MSTLLIKGFYASALSTFQWLYIVGCGIIAKKYNFVDDKFKSCLSKVVTNIILPCFIFAQVVVNFRLSQYIIIIHATLGCLVIYGLGLLVGYGIAKILRLRKSQANFLSAVFSTPHNTSIYVILIQVMGPFLDTILPSNPNYIGKAEKRGLLYVVINSIFSNVWKWSYCYYFIEPEDEEEDESKVPLLQEGNENINSNIITNEVSVEKPKMKYKPKNLMKSIVNMPLITSIFTLLIACFPSFQRVIITPGSVLRDTLVDVNRTIAKSYSFVVIFILGLSFSESLNYKPDEKNRNKNFLTKSILFWLALVKLIVMPIFTTPIVLYLFRSILHVDDVLTFTFLFLGAAPPAINIIVICTYKNAFVHEISSLMIVMYIAAIITLTFWIAIFFYILGKLNNSLI